MTGRVERQGAHSALESIPSIRLLQYQLNYHLGVSIAYKREVLSLRTSLQGRNSQDMSIDSTSSPKEGI